MAFDGVQQRYVTYGLWSGELARYASSDTNEPVMLAESWRAVKKMNSIGTQMDDIILDAAWRGLHVTTELMKRFVKKYYRRPHFKSYFSGCGAGGRQGIKAISSFPEDYDGVV
jgi:hypothetical protein